MTRKQAYYQAMQPFADVVREHYMHERLLYREDAPDGSTRVVVHETGVFERDPSGRLSFRWHDERGQRDTSYPLLVRWNRRFWLDLLNHTEQVSLRLTPLVDHLRPPGHVTDADYDHDAHDDFGRAYARHLKRIEGGFAGLGPRRRARWLISLLQTLVDPTIFRLVATCAPPTARTSTAYNALVGVHHPERVAPGILAAYFTLHDAIEGPTDAVDLTHRTQRVLHDLGLSRAGWRYLTRSSSACGAALFDPATGHLSDRDRVRFLNLLSASGETPRLTTLSALKSAYAHAQRTRAPDRDERSFERTFAQYARMLARHTQRMRSIRDFAAVYRNGFEPHATLHMDWLNSGVTLTGAQAALPYRWWHAQATAWHDDPDGPVQQRRRTNQQRHQHAIALEQHLAPLRARHQRERHAHLARHTSITSPLPTLKHGRVSATALTTPSALSHEGQSMQHCVGSYWHAQLRGSSRIYHLSGNQHHSTLELAHNGHRWVIHQHVTTRNRAPTASHQQTAHAILERYRALHPHAHTDHLGDLEARQQRELDDAERAFLAQRTSAPSPARRARPRPQPHAHPGIVF